MPCSSPTALEIMSTMTTTWTKARQDGKTAFDKGWAAFEKLGGPVNRLSNKMGCEAFWPMTLDHECDKSARILKSFCEEGIYTDQPSPPPTTGPREIPKVLLKIPPKVIQNCVGLAIFTVMRTGLWVSGAAGSGVLIARKEDGSWSSPSGLLVHTLGVGVMAGIDIYDCVIVINNRSALDAFSKVRVSLGGEVSLAAGPLGVGGMVESEVMGDRTPVFSYVKSKGLYAGAQLDGTVIVERNDENRRFYGEELGVGEILRGGVERVPKETGLLMGVLREIDGRGGAVRRSVSVERKDEEVDEKIQDYVLPPEYEKVESMEDLYSPPSPRPIQGLSGGDLLFQHSPIQGSTKDLCLPSLPPRPSSQNDDVLISK